MMERKAVVDVLKTKIVDYAGGKKIAVSFLLWTGPEAIAAKRAAEQRAESERVAKQAETEPAEEEEQQLRPTE